MSSLIIFSLKDVYAISEPILITQSSGMNDVIFDGKWTNYLEWKPSSYNMISYDDGSKIYLRTAHYENFIYVFVDPINDQTLDKNSDKATICIDGKNEKNMLPDNNDFCFTVALGQNQGKVFQGNSISKQSGHFKRISTIDNFIAISNTSDENDRYTTIPHPSYEFKIPIEIIKRSNNYGFYMSVYDANTNTFYSWPKEIHRDGHFDIPSPEKWGDIISPDKSLPEFNFSSFILIFLVSAIIILQTRVKYGNSRIFFI
ncbi:MAG: hypothetical protein ACW9XH_02730 [Candidatus Nitrosopumilus sp. bin_32a]